MKYFNRWRNLTEFLLIIAGSLFFWGFLYPDMCMSQDMMVIQTEDGELQFIETNAQYWEALEFDQDSLVIKSKWIKDIGYVNKK